MILLDPGRKAARLVVGCCLFAVVVGEAFAASNLTTSTATSDDQSAKIASLGFATRSALLSSAISANTTAAPDFAPSGYFYNVTKPAANTTIMAFNSTATHIAGTATMVVGAQIVYVSGHTPSVKAPASSTPLAISHALSTTAGSRTTSSVTPTDESTASSTHSDKYFDIPTTTSSAALQWIAPPSSTKRAKSRESPLYFDIPSTTSSATPTRPTHKRKAHASSPQWDTPLNFAVTSTTSTSRPPAPTWDTTYNTMMTWQETYARLENHKLTMVTKNVTTSTKMAKSAFAAHRSAHESATRTHSSSKAVATVPPPPRYEMKHGPPHNASLTPMQHDKLKHILLGALLPPVLFTGGYVVGREFWSVIKTYRRLIPSMTEPLVKTLLSSEPGCGEFCDVPGFWADEIVPEGKSFWTTPNEAERAIDPETLLVRAPDTHARDFHFKTPEMPYAYDQDEYDWFDDTLPAERQFRMETSQWYKTMRLDPNAVTEQHVRELTRDLPRADYNELMENVDKWCHGQACDWHPSNLDEVRMGGHPDNYVARQPMETLESWQRWVNEVDDASEWFEQQGISPVPEALPGDMGPPYFEESMVDQIKQALAMNSDNRPWNMHGEDNPFTFENIERNGWPARPRPQPKTPDSGSDADDQGPETSIGAANASPTLLDGGDTAASGLNSAFNPDPTSAPLSDHSKGPPGTSDDDRITLTEPLLNAYMGNRLFYNAWHIWGADWNSTLFNGDDGHGAFGARLHHELKHCALFRYHFETVDPKDSDRMKFHAWGRSGIAQGKCMQHAMKRAGAPHGGEYRCETIGFC